MKKPRRSGAKFEIGTMVNATILAWSLGPFGCVAATVAGESEAD